MVGREGRGEEGGGGEEGRGKRRKVRVWFIAGSLLSVAG